jgi:hypothetical protein
MNRSCNKTALAASYIKPSKGKNNKKAKLSTLKPNEHTNNRTH